MEEHNVLAMLCARLSEQVRQAADALYLHTVRYIHARMLMGIE